ncbi:MAG: hypothetical protein A3F31_03500 [Candidatus Levybacteria bacterium RIFCSPHIGHO2_12_FULL_38_12]|nr:MAG: hypothetical protein A2770_04805 [Candidatus Levybacteria bacterium RIFCSPHIGHO2_01_FULL_38_12]OGH21576.1 MAG: hypothetical protein A3D75_02430 [Candidatus Levybacteria bacterium RIFCSPHIGHO2_02_FULL_37_18]OGH22873.1 MAG: hypothetical protein A3F31_03500 [Candidatus Levybacteria bacterium RIFCSPHIGHO2_12_FULL_38_12]OGH34741.1 MAG: hypothetical protein A3A47_01110 [Candidatus Levybacteria bacterium RIFCSPLOWO2_01_FULL_37_20]OGH43588.1 MAG: hypothetical protein A3J14_03345 [Candidatus Lev
MRVKKKKSTVDSQKIAFYFVLGIASLLFVSFVFRAIILVSKSKFDGHHRFTIQVSKSGQKEEALISLEPSSRMLSVLHLPEGPAVNPVSRFLEVPIDGHVILTSESQDRYLVGLLKLETDIGGKDVSLILAKLILQYNQLKTDLTIMDIVRFAWFSKGVHKNMVKFVAVSKSLTESSIDRISSSFFPDTDLQKENATIAVVNATGVSGLGNRLARFISNMGGTVVSVSTGKSDEEDSKIIKRTKKSYTFSKLLQVTGFREAEIITPTPVPPDSLSLIPKEESIETQDSFVSDIIVVIGKKSLSKFVF